MPRKSIRRKIRTGYIAVVLMILGLSVFTFFEINYLKRKIVFGEAISEFFDVTLEIRRFEKNYFLYSQRSDFEESIRYVSRAAELLDHNAAGFALLSSAERISALRQDLNKYRNLMERYERVTRRNGGPPPVTQDNPAKLAAGIRKTGKDIVTVAEEIARTERRTLQAQLSNARSVLFLSIGLLVILTVIIGQVLERLVVKPLKLMERSMETIADGNFEHIKINSREREVLSLTRAFNKMLRELEIRQRHLVQSEKLASLGTLLSGVAHELNNPLSNISTSGQILAEEFREAKLKPATAPWPLDPDFSQELVEQINDQTDRARNIVRSLLEFSRDKDFKKQTLGLRALVEETLRFVKGQASAGVMITVDVPDDLTVTVDKQRIQQAFLNLIKNAIEALPAEGTVAISARKRKAMDKVDDETSIHNYLKYHGKCTLEDDTVDIEIHDSGSGIPADILSKVFDPFFTTKDVGKGSGLGLFIVHEIIEEHDGCIAVDSEAGRGTVFLIRLPLK